MVLGKRTAYGPRAPAGAAAGAMVRRHVRQRVPYGTALIASYGGGMVRRGRRASDTGPELKFFGGNCDVAAADLSAGVIIDSAAGTGTFNNIDQGASESQRIGRKIIIKSFNWRGMLKYTPPSNTLTSQTVRLMLVLDKQCNGATATVSGAGGVLDSTNYQSFNELSNKGRFRVLLDRTFDLSAQAAVITTAPATEQMDSNTSFTFFKNLNIPIEFNAATGAIAEIRTNNLFGIMITETSTSNVALDSIFRIRFLDG